MVDFFEILDSKGVKYTTKGGRIVVGGDLDLEGTAITSLPDGLIVGGCLDLEGTAITSLPDGLIVGNFLDLEGTNITSLPNGLIVGDFLDLRGTNITSLPDGLTIGGNLYLNGTGITSLPDGLIVGDFLDLSYTPITSLPDSLIVGDFLGLSGTPLEHLDVTSYEYQNTNFLSWQNGRYIIVDGLFTEVVQRKGNVWRVKRVGHEKVFYLVTDGEGKYAHGGTLDEARESLVFKLSKRSVEDYKHLTLESVLTFAEAVSCYRVITGACEFGVKQFVEQNKIKKQDYTVQQMLELTTDAYGGSTFSKFFK